MTNADPGKSSRSLHPEVPSQTRTIVGVFTLLVTAFVGYLRRGPLNLPVQLIQLLGDFERIFGGLDTLSELSYQVNQFFINGEPRSVGSPRSRHRRRRLL